MKTMDNGKVFKIIDNRNYIGESKWIFATYYYVGSNPLKALISLIRKK